METKHKAMSIIKEFRIGNLVADYETEPHYFAIEEIGLYEDGELAVWYRNGSIMHKDPDLIPLTEEWLLKAGAKRFGKDFTLHGVIIHSRKRGFVINKHIPTMEYLHQLQNFIFANRGKELEFKL